MTTTAPCPETLSLSHRDEAVVGGDKAPAWLRRVIALIESEAANIAPIRDNRGEVPEYIYRH